MFGIKEMTAEDLEEVAALEKEIFSTPWSRQGFADTMRQEAALYLAVRENGRLAGYCGLLQSFDEAEIVNVAVAPAFRRQGIGAAMLTELMERGYARGIANYTLEVRESNRGALHLYEKLGFERVGVRKNFYEKPREDAVIMWSTQKRNL